MPWNGSRRGAEGEPLSRKLKSEKLLVVSILPNPLMEDEEELSILLKSRE